MNKHGINQFLWNVCLFFAIGLFGCEKTDYLLYDTNQKAGLYYMSADADSAVLRSKSSVDTVRFDITLTTLGTTVNYDREIAYELLETNMAEGKYSVVARPMKAGEVTSIIRVEFYKDLAMEGKTEYIIFRILDNDNFRILREMTPEQFYISNQVVPVEEPKWWNNQNLGPFSIPLYEKMVSTFVSLKAANPSLYAVMSEELGENLEFEPTSFIFIWPLGYIQVYSGEMWGKYKYPMLKNVVYPLFLYYQENPDENVNIPEPDFYL